MSAEACISLDFFLSFVTLVNSSKYTYEREEHIWMQERECNGRMESFA
jgi:hypothetical protein